MPHGEAGVLEIVARIAMHSQALHHALRAQVGARRHRDHHLQREKPRERWALFRLEDPPAEAVACEFRLQHRRIGDGFRALERRPEELHDPFVRAHRGPRVEIVLAPFAHDEARRFESRGHRARFDAGRARTGLRVRLAETRELPSRPTRNESPITALLEPVRRDERVALGRSIRDRVKRSSHCALPARPAGYDLIAEIEAANAGRIASLVPIRSHRMATSAFQFYRGSADVMAFDLSQTPVTGIEVQLGGDAHCANFGAFASPERNLIFDVRDFDETLRGPWEWDVKRLAASFVLASRESDASDSAAERAVRRAIASYREKMHEFAEMSTLDVWYSRVDVRLMLSHAGSNTIRKRRRTYVDGIGRRTIRKAYDDMTEPVGDSRRFIDEPPLVYHAAPGDDFFDVAAVFASYRETLAPDVRALFDRYRMVDWVVKVVGVGSVGTRCAAALFLADDDDPLILQIKEAGASVHERYLAPSPFGNHGERVVVGQRTMQAASDIFLGWTRSNGRDFYVRQLRDMKGVPDLEEMADVQRAEFAAFCGWTLAGAHARSGHAAQIAGYLGRGEVFDEALVAFSIAYADRAQADHDLLLRAIDAGRIVTRET